MSWGKGWERRRNPARSTAWTGTWAWAKPPVISPRSISAGFTQGFARGLGITGPVNSPTFTIVQQYEEGRLPLYHFDVYRIGDISEMDEIGYEDCFYGSGVSLIEWSELIEELLPERAVHVTIEKDLERGFDFRRIRVEGLE